MGPEVALKYALVWELNLEVRINPFVLRWPLIGCCLLVEGETGVTFLCGGPVGRDLPPWM